MPAINFPLLCDLSFAVIWQALKDSYWQACGKGLTC